MVYRLEKTHRSAAFRFKRLVLLLGGAEGGGALGLVHGVQPSVRDLLLLVLPCAVF